MNEMWYPGDMGVWKNEYGDIGQWRMPVIFVVLSSVCCCDKGHQDHPHYHVTGYFCEHKRLRNVIIDVGSRVTELSIRLKSA